MPQATLSKPISYFAGRHGLSFTEYLDDLDYSDGAAFEFDGKTFALMRYRREPADTITIYHLADPVANPIVSEIILKMLGELDLSEADVVWMRTEAE